MAKSKTNVRRSSGGMAKAKYERAIQSARAASKRARERSADRMGAFVGMLIGAGIGYAEKENKVSPKVTSPGALAGIGLAAVMFGPRSGKLAGPVAELGASAMTLSGYKLGHGEAVIGAEEDGWSQA